ncbi:Hypothetical protein PHPALM_6143 [Phytophthora palmivora]|uniref:Uncharacterized protein n=1 Tax=Phytophthora palmivora TaxID=4796 RepID=A0A2P4YFL0_9STRA|nr:Hypothetical protein PHPALM_6143 [Phytophthora palmivora]
MDVSDTGICVLEPQLKQFIRAQFDQATRDMFASLKEQNSIITLGYKWGVPGSDRPHVRMLIDNTIALSRLNKLSSRHPIARTYKRLISLSEFVHGFTCTAKHIPGEWNIMVDAGSKAWSTDHPLYGPWTNLSNSWTQVQIQPPLKKSWKYHRRFIGIELSASPDFTILLQGITRLSPPTCKLQPITPAVLRLLYRRLDIQQPQERLIWGSILMGFSFLLRRSEYLYIGPGSELLLPKVPQCFLLGRRRCTNRLSQSNFGNNRPRMYQEQSIRPWSVENYAHVNGPALSPVVTLRHIRKSIQQVRYTGQYLCGDLNAVVVADALKSTPRSIGVPDSNYPTHYIHIGGATTLVSGNASDVAIKLLG